MQKSSLCLSLLCVLLSVIVFNVCKRIVSEKDEVQSPLLGNLTVKQARFYFFEDLKKQREAGKQPLKNQFTQTLPYIGQSHQLSENKPANGGSGGLF